jgi:hypothetical protein
VKKRALWKFIKIGRFADSVGGILDCESAMVVEVFHLFVISSIKKKWMQLDIMENDIGDQ